MINVFPDPKPTGVDRFYAECAYFAALVLWLVEHKDDREADAEIADMLKNGPWLSSVLMGVLDASSK